MNWNKMITLYGVHCEGEVGRVITSGVIDLPGETMLDKMHYLNNTDNSLRRFSLFEPRGSAQMSANLLLPPTQKEADAAFIVMQPDAAYALSGSNTMCVTTALLETGIIKIHGSTTKLILDTPAGLIPVVAKHQNNKVESVTIDVCPSFVEHIDYKVAVPGIGSLSVDVAFGGCYFAMVDIDQLDITISPESARILVDFGSRLKKEINKQIRVQHPEVSAFNSIDYVMFTGKNPINDLVYRNATILPPGRVDRSPCGTGSSSRMAVMHAKGLLSKGEKIFMESIIGGRFEAMVADETIVGDRKAIIPRLTGRCWIYSIEHLGVHPTDPFPLGYVMADTWGPDVNTCT